MTIGIVGLGLIGGSFAKALKKNTTHTVFGFDIDESVILKAQLINAIDSPLENKNIVDCNYLIITTYPKDAVEFIRNNAKYINKNTVIFDCCGTKQKICDSAFEIAKEFGFKFIGGHPMAGTQYSGLKYSRNDMFKNANMILVPSQREDIETIENVKRLLTQIGFKSITISSAKQHDKLIAYTSQLAHIVSNAYVKSPNAMVHKGFSAGSYKDLTRVAKLNPSMWTELFLENKENILFELDNLINQLKNYKDALETENYDELFNLLSEGSILKEKSENNG